MATDETTTMTRYRALLDGGEGGEITIDASGEDAAWEEATEWAMGGSWHTDPEETRDGLRYASVRARLSLVEVSTDEDGEEDLDDVRSEDLTVWDADEESEALLPEHLRCSSEDGHEWGSGGDEWGGVRSHGGLAMSHRSVCEHCGVRRDYYHDHQHSYSWRDTVTYSAPGDEEV